MSSTRGIGPQEDNIVRFLARYVRATAEQCTRYSYSKNSVRHVRGYLNNLIEKGMLVSSTGFSQDGRPPLVYSLTMPGWRYAEGHFGMPIPKRWRPSEQQFVSFRDYRHDLAITDLGIAVERACRGAGPYMKFVQFVHDRFMPQHPMRLSDGSRREGRLDAFVELAVRADEAARFRRRFYLVEIDGGTHAKRAIEDKIRFQIDYVESRAYHADFQTEALTAYLWLSPGDPERVRELVSICEDVLLREHAEDYAPLLLFTAANPATVEPTDFFVNEEWVVPLQPEPAHLISYAPFERRVRSEPSHFMDQDAYDKFSALCGDQPGYLPAELDGEV